MATVCPDTGDSPLSTVGNVLGILTFALGLFAYVAAFVAVTKDADKDVKATLAIVKAIQQNVELVTDDLRKKNNRAEPEMMELFRPLQGSLGAYSDAVTEINSQLERFKAAGHAHSSSKTRLSIWSRFMWWYKESERQAAIAHMRSCQEHFAAVQLAYIGRQVERMAKRWNRKVRQLTMHRKVDKQGEIVRKLSMNQQAVTKGSDIASNK